MKKRAAGQSKRVRDRQKSSLEAAVVAMARSSIAAHERYAAESAQVIAAVANKLSETFAQDHTVFFFGNGGSAADSQHVAAELIGRFRRERRSLPAIALTTDTSILTAIGNDYEYAQVFARQVSGLARPGDVAVGISTSGRSENVLRALAVAKERGAYRIGFTGERRAAIDDHVDLCFHAPATETSRIQELHLLAWHSICELIEQSLFDE